MVSGHSEVSIGGRLSTGDPATRGLKGERISRAFLRLVCSVLGGSSGDAQCGLTALRADVARRLVPQVVDRSWFFDTELLVRAERAGLRIHTGRLT